MNNISSEKFWRGIKKARNIRYICTGVLVAIAVLFFIIGFIESKRDLGVPKDLSNIDNKKSDEYVYIDVARRLFMFTEGNYRSLNFVWDIDGKLYKEQLSMIKYMCF